ncbi:MAG TPA: 50S ribosomal protein L14 [Candidatus Omnitrophica bacterium]|nr:MAG: 50S ribosomal protein L14 [Omnitrophica WOR_2 bacterium GWA2_45_18]OGX19674.1 MAG: 50S ribosomal protein L14 [Omnitrophica WOR_2 bacterium GWC2_45_7]HBR14646.1 50S ribosomal protein L14 [Candidatus Omnitrophota bacterium]
MIYMKTILNVADNTGARKASMIGVLNSKGRRCAHIGDIVRVNIKESAPEAAIKKGEKARGIIVRTKCPIRRSDGTYVKFDTNAVVIIDEAGNPKGTRVFGPVARELRNMNYMKIVSLAPEVV